MNSAEEHRTGDAIDLACMHFKLLQSCPTLCDPVDYSPPGSSVHGILQEEYCSGFPCPPPGETELIYRKYHLPPVQVTAAASIFDYLRLLHLFFQSSLHYSQNYIYIYILLLLLLTVPCSMQDLSSLTRDRTLALNSESAEF